MIRVKRFSPTGEFIDYIMLDIAKPEVAAAIQQAIQKGEGSVAPSDLEKLDGQGISLSKLLSLGFSADDIRAAARRRLAVIDKALHWVEDVEDELDSMLGPEFAAGRPAARQIPAGGVPKVNKSQTAADILKAANDAYKRSGRA